MADSQNADLSKLQINRDRSTESKPRSNRRLWLGVGIAAIMIAAFFLFRNTLTPIPEVETAMVVLTSPAQSGALLNASGYVVAQRKAAIASKGTGRLVRLTVVEGDRVKKNMIIGQLEDSDVRAALAQARASLAINRADLTDAKQTLERTQKLFTSSLSSQAELDAAQARYDRVIASIEYAKAAIVAAEVSIENTLIRAPFDGTVLTKNADVGEVIAPFSTSASSRGAVVTIADMSSLEVEADVSESNIERLQPGQPCEITLDAFPGKRYRGTVSKIVPTVDRAKATVKTKVKFVDRDESVLPEMSAKVAFLSEALSDSAVAQKPKLTVAPSAIISRDGKKFVFTIKENIVTETPITTGGAVGTLIEVLDGIRPGDRVVLRPAESLRSGTRVKIAQQ
jgi:RND family efflux transporter MFP subunit